LAAERRQRIAGEVQQRGAVRVAELAALLDASEMTIRRDLDVLHDDGTVIKVHGGATIPGQAKTFEPGFEAKSTQQAKEKRAIARRAATYVKPGMAIGLTAGTTTWTFARELARAAVPDLTVVTNSLHVADVLHQHPDGRAATVILVGGVRTPSDALVGPLAVSALGQLSFDAVFLGVHGIDTKAGLSTPNLDEAETNRAFVAAASRLIVLADHTKWGTVGLSTMATLDQTDVLITDDGIPRQARTTLENTVGELVIATSGEE